MLFVISERVVDVHVEHHKLLLKDVQDLICPKMVLLFLQINQQLQYLVHQSHIPPVVQLHRLQIVI